MTPKELYDKCVVEAELNPKFKFCKDAFGNFGLGIGCALTCAFKLDFKHIRNVLDMEDMEKHITHEQMNDFVTGFDRHKPYHNLPEIDNFWAAGWSFAHWVTEHNRWYYS